MSVGPSSHSWCSARCLVVAYNLELFGGVIHNDAGFALAWGSFPVLVAYVAQTGRLAVSPVIAAVAAFALSAAQRQLSTPARLIRRQASGGGPDQAGECKIGAHRSGHAAVPLEQALGAMSWGVVLVAAAVAIARLS